MVICTCSALGRLTDPDVLARNFFYSQCVLLEPTFGQHYVMGLPSSKLDNKLVVENKSFDNVLREDHVASRETVQDPSAVKALQNWTRCVCLTYEDAFLRFAREIATVYMKIFSPDNVRHGVTNFFDRVMAEKIQFKTLRLTDTSIVLAPWDLHSSHVAQLFRFPTKTAEHTMRALTQIWMTDSKIMSLVTLSAQEPAKKYELGVVTECLLAVGSLKLSETKIAHVRGTLYGSQSISYHVPRNLACEELLLRTLGESIKGEQAEDRCGNWQEISLESLVRETVMHVDATIRSLVKKYLTFPAFLLLIHLLGVSLIEDELPTVVPVGTGSSEFVSQSKGMQGALDEGDEDYEIWRDYLADIAEIPSLKPRLLDILTEDETREMHREYSSVQKFFSTKPRMERDSVNRAEVTLLRARKAQFSRNISRVRLVFNQIAQNSGFLPANLADEAIFLLLDNRLGLSGTRACLKYLCVDSPDPHVGRPLAETFHLSNPDETTIIHLHGAPDQDIEKLDWTFYRHYTGWTPDLIESYRKMTSSSPGFIGKSQIPEFIKLVEAKYTVGNCHVDKEDWNQMIEERPSGAQWNRANRRSMRKKGMQLNEWQTIMQVMVTPDVFHRVTSNLGVCVSRQHATMFWYLVCRELDKTEFEPFIPAAQVCGTFTRILYQPVTAQGSKYFGAALSDIHDFAGCLPSFALVYLLRAMGLDVSDKHVKAMWEDLPKDPLSLKWILGTNRVPLLDQSLDENGADAEENSSVVECASSGDTEGETVLSSLSTQSKERRREEARDCLLRVDMDQFGLNPTKGAFTSLQTVRRHLTDMLLTGLPPEGLSIFVRLACKLEIEEDRLEAVTNRFSPSLNKYGVYEPDMLIPLLCTLHVEGVSFSMLRSIVDQMRLKLPERDVKRMFDMMDINQNRFLELSEILFGFEMLCKVFVPEYIVTLLHYDAYSQLENFFLALVTCLILFAFLSFTIRSFSGSDNNSLSQTMQTLLAVVGAIAFRTTTRAKDPELDAQIVVKMAMIFGDDFEKRYAEATRPDVWSLKKEITSVRGKPFTGSVSHLRLQYIIPRKNMPLANDRYPCAIFHTSEDVLLEPQVSGHGGDVKKLLWSILPRFPNALGLYFDTDTGVISGRIGSGCEETLKHGGITPKQNSLQRTTFLINCRHPSRGTARFHFTMRVVDRPAAGANIMPSLILNSGTWTSERSETASDS